MDNFCLIKSLQPIKCKTNNPLKELSLLLKLLYLMPKDLNYKQNLPLKLFLLISFYRTLTTQNQSMLKGHPIRLMSVVFKASNRKPEKTSKIRVPQATEYICHMEIITKNVSSQSSQQRILMT